MTRWDASNSVSTPGHASNHGSMLLNVGYLGKRRCKQESARTKARRRENSKAKTAARREDTTKESGKESLWEKGKGRDRDKKGKTTCPFVTSLEICS